MGCGHGCLCVNSLAIADTAPRGTFTHPRIFSENDPCSCQGGGFELYAPLCNAMINGTANTSLTTSEADKFPLISLFFEKYFLSIVISVFITAFIFLLFLVTNMVFDMDEIKTELKQANVQNERMTTKIESHLQDHKREKQRNSQLSAALAAKVRGRKTGRGRGRERIRKFRLKLTQTSDQGARRGIKCGRVKL